MALFELAQLNLAIPKHSLDSPQMADFTDNIDRINTLAEASPGFVWRLPADDDEPNPFGAEALPNLSVWAGAEALRAFVYRSEHAGFIRRRREWFTQLAEAHIVLWWVARGNRPTLAHAAARLDHLRRFGPTPEAFTFGYLVAPPEAPGGPRRE